MKFIYGLGIAVAALMTINFVEAGFTDSTSRGILLLLVSPLTFLVPVVILRIYLEIVIVVFRIAKHLREMNGPR